MEMVFVDKLIPWHHFSKVIYLDILYIICFIYIYIYIYMSTIYLYLHYISIYYCLYILYILYMLSKGQTMCPPPLPSSCCCQSANGLMATHVLWNMMYGSSITFMNYAHFTSVGFERSVYHESLLSSFIIYFIYFLYLFYYIYYYLYFFIFMFYAQVNSRQQLLCFLSVN